MDMDLVMSIAFIMIAVAFVARTVFYAIEVLVNTKATKRSLKIVNKLFKAYEPVFNYLGEYIKKVMNDDV